MPGRSKSNARHFFFLLRCVSLLSLAAQETAMLTTVFACPSISSTSSFGNMHRVIESATVSVFASSAVVENIEIRHRLIPLSCHIPARCHHLSYFCMENIGSNSSAILLILAISIPQLQRKSEIAFLSDKYVNVLNYKLFLCSRQAMQIRTWEAGGAFVKKKK
jgi:hypothetical protein